MSTIASQATTSTLSHDSRDSTHEEDWDRSESNIQVDSGLRTPRNSVQFPVDGTSDLSPRKCGGRENRTLSELLKHYAEKGTDCQFSQEEATRIADVLGQWINSGSSPYEAEDDFFSKDDSVITTRRSSVGTADNCMLGRPRGSSESRVNSRPVSRNAGFVKS
ncbi:hypothetical protein BJ322DRAFT_1050552 [Thelephora terrestris]|uniref:Uncharacterized protein n=1 Tax=Thelephora terrestris TaxID=56493 RepID=A0A9P6HLP1_9AGAM|nr:hypothetical protein BJ322DRAFT_1050552 [Thelephora terrestris]